MTITLSDTKAQEVRALLARLAELLVDDVPGGAVAPVQPSPAASGPAAALTDQDYADAATALGCDVAMIRAVDRVESNGHGFGPDGRPIILFEPHVFSRLTNHKFDSSYGGVSYPKWGEKPYPPSQAARWDQLLFAAKLDHDAAYQSASYGRFQIMGFNFGLCGFATVGAFVDAMGRSERDHLMAFVQFVLSSKLDDELRTRDLLAFATRYNGPGQASAYAAKLSAALAA
jgi:hypothetical protein